MVGAGLGKARGRPESCAAPTLACGDHVLPPSPYRTALVTGASRGIGAAIAQSLRARGLEVLAVARSGDALAELARRTGARALPLDITDRERCARELAGLEIDVLVNNAGSVASVGPFALCDPEAIEAQVQLNLTAQLQLTRLLLPGMIARGRGHLFFLGSLAGGHPYRDLALYGATKAAIRMFASCLRVDLAGSGVRVTEIAPGRVLTDIYLDVMAGDRAAMHGQLYARHRALDPGDVAAALAAALDLPPHADVSLLEIAPTDQAPGGVVYAERREG